MLSGMTKRPLWLTCINRMTHTKLDFSVNASTQSGAPAARRRGICLLGEINTGVCHKCWYALTTSLYCFAGLPLPSTVHTEWLKTTGIYCLTVLEFRKGISRAMFLLEHPTFWAIGVPEGSERQYPAHSESNSLDALGSCICIWLFSEIIFFHLSNHLLIQQTPSC